MTNASERIVNTRIVTDDDTGEFVVKAYTESGRLPIADYYTDDRDDAEETARAMVRGAVEPLPIQESAKSDAERESDAYKDGVGVDCGDPVVEEWDSAKHTEEILRKQAERESARRDPLKGFSVALFDGDEIEVGRVSLGGRRFVSVRGNVLLDKIRRECGEAIADCVREDLEDRDAFEEHEDALRQHERDMGLRS